MASISKKGGNRVAPSTSRKLYWLAGVCLVLAFITGYALWYGRPQTIEQMIPIVTEKKLNCDVSLYCGGTEDDYQGTLTKAQLETMLTYFNGETLGRLLLNRSDISTQHQSTLPDGTARLYFWQNDTNERYELLLLEDSVVVCDLSHNKREAYSFSGGQEKQKELFWYLYAILAPESKKRTIASIHMDFDGDGDNDVVRVCTTPNLKRAEDASQVWIWDENLYHYTLEWERDGQLAAKTVLDGGKGDVYTEHPTVFMTQDQQGNQLVVVGVSTPFHGETETFEVYVVGWKEEAPIQLDIPEYTVQSTLDGTTAQVLVPETGNAEQLDLNWWLQQRNGQMVQDGKGVMIWPTAPSQADSICAVTQGVQGIRIAQYVWGDAHTDGMGWLLTYLTWNDEKPVVIDQYFSWRPQTVEEAMRE